MSAKWVDILRCAALGLLLLGGPGGAFASNPPAAAAHAERPRFRAELSAFTEAESSFVSLLIELPRSELSFRRDASGGLGAEFDIIVHVFNDAREVTADIWHERISAADRSELRGSERMFRKNLVFHLPPGAYTVETTVAQPSAGQSGMLRLSITVPFPIPGQVRIGSILIGECGLTGRLAELRADMRTGRTFDLPVTSLCAYTELYHPGLAIDSLSLVWSLVAEASGETVARATEVIRAAEVMPGGVDAIRLSWTLPLPAESRGSFRVEANVTVDTTKVQAAADFALGSPADPPLDLFFRESLGALEYIAEGDEVQVLRMAAPGERAALWEAFWARRDTDPDTPENEFKEEFMRRLDHANLQFTAIRPGWRTDRGRIYILCGEPDEIEKVMQGVGGQATEIWYYQNLGRTFIFVDERGYGDYELVSGEL